MYAQLGNIRFEGLKGFSSLEEKFGVNYAQHDRINGKPRLESVGDVLDSISFDMRLHSQFTDPESDIEAIRSAMKNREILPLILGNGTVVGNFVIPSFSKTTEFTDPTGNIISANLSIELLEAFNENPLDESKKQAKNSAFANSSKNSNVRSVVPAKVSPGMAGVKNVTKIEMSGKLVTQRITAAEQNPASSDFNSGKIVNSLDDIENSIADLQGQLSSSQSLLDLATSLPTALQSVNTQVQNMRAVLPISDINDVKTINRQLYLSILNAKTASIGITNQSVIRRK